MIRKQTTFVLGAGFSCEVGMPLGVALKDQIIAVLRRAISDEPGHALLLALRTGNENANRSACRTLIDALPLAVSIDNLVEHRSDDPALVHCAKVGIAAAILQAESKSELRIIHPAQRSYQSRTVRVRHSSDDEIVDAPRLSRAGQSSFFSIFQILMPGVPKSQLRDSLQSLSFINFNYDRCLEHFLYYALQTHSSLSPTEAGELVDSIPIWHPYGTVGRLPWQRNTLGSAIDFGTVGDSTDLVTAASQLRTFSEEIEESESLSELRGAISNAQRLVFLGLAWNEQNMRLLEPPEGLGQCAVHGTCYKTPPLDKGGVMPSIQEFAAPDIEAFADVLERWRLKALPKDAPGNIGTAPHPGFEVSTCHQLLAKYENLFRSR